MAKIMRKKKQKSKLQKQKNIMSKIPENFKHFQDCVNWVKKSTYMIARGKKQTKDWKEMIVRTTLWTWFVVAPHRMITCSHVINDVKNKQIHKDWDTYYIIRHDDNNQVHGMTFTPMMDKEIFLYPEKDLWIIYLDKFFYGDDNKKLKQENEFIKISKEVQSIWTEIWILWYPLCKLTFKDSRLDCPLIWNILLRTDKWVVNCSYKDLKGINYYEFTLPFNAGNSWWPIFDTQTWKLIWIVHGYKKIIIGATPMEIEYNWEKKKIDNIDSSYYSIWISVVSILTELEKHHIIK